MASATSHPSLLTPLHCTNLLAGSPTLRHSTSGHLPSFFPLPSRNIFRITAWFSHSLVSFSSLLKYSLMGDGFPFPLMLCPTPYHQPYRSMKKNIPSLVNGIDVIAYLYGGKNGFLSPTVTKLIPGKFKT